MDFFRKEVMRRREETLIGPLLIVNTVSWANVSMYLSVACGAAIIIVGTATSPGSITAEGVLSVEEGVVQIVAPRAGNIYSDSVIEGERVSAGQTIVTVAIDDVGWDGKAAGKINNDALEAEEKLAEQRLVAARAKFKSDEASSQIRARELISQITAAEERRRGLDALIAKMAASYDIARQVAARGFVSQQDLVRREEALLDRKDALAVQQRDSDTDRGELQRLSEQRQAAREENTLATAELTASRMRLRQARAEQSLKQGYELRATRAGIVRNLEARVGDHVDAGATLAIIAPSKEGAWIARLELDDRAAALIQEGDSLALTLSAFPPTRYGYLPGKILRIQRTPKVPNKPSAPTYRAVASVNTTGLLARRSPVRLVDGMTVRASISLTGIGLLDRLRQPSLWFRQL